MTSLGLLRHIGARLLWKLNQNSDAIFGKILAYMLYTTFISVLNTFELRPTTGCGFKERVNFAERGVAKRVTSRAKIVEQLLEQTSQLESGIKLDKSV